MIEISAEKQSNPVVLPFPEGFLWGSGNSAFQVEGGPGIPQPRSEWSRWELTHQPAEKRSDQSAAHYKYFQEDFELFRKLGQNAHRFGIEWARIEPERGDIDQSAINHYKDVVKSLKDNELTPILTLNHFTNPDWFVDLGGWANTKAAHYFNAYTERMANELGDDVPFWCTVNEPSIYTMFAYLSGDFPPQQKNYINAFKAYVNMAKAHKTAYNTIHETLPNAQVGVANAAVYVEPTNPLNPLEQTVSFSAANLHRLFYPLSGGSKTHDYIGLNYYESRKALSRGIIPELVWTSSERSDLGWGIVPEGVYKLIINLKRYNRPVIITENGIADAQDRLRTRYIVDHLKAVHRAIEGGVDVMGYIYWSSTDNMELHRGYEPKFGFVAVDFETLKRTPRPSVYAYKEIAENNGITARLAELPPIR